ncbi:Histidine kinase-like ATPase domain-containing protein [Actinokineospora diospyrosa]|uniref:Histidine kinase-like ATPase domain-containing protein n=2 Tax=Actinokineospora diospyrosa TaxID=103728 RepID=A0ABT1IJD4_9PSEU|nr:Histidine kinase-like ATPase domain-containing protein [Actinokineospora diospyrosa]
MTGCYGGQSWDMTTHQDLAVFSTTVPARAEHLAPLRRRVRRWLAHCRVPAPVRQDVVLAAHEALSDAIDQPGAGERTTVTLHCDRDGVVLTAVDHFTWTARAHRGDDPGERRLRVIARVAERVDLDVGADGGTLTAYFTLSR